jgi:predicted phage replisome organizer
VSSNPKKYYWLKFKVDFFSDIRLLKLRSVAGGDTYIVIFLKLMLLSIKNEGIVIYEGVFPSLAEELSYSLREDIKNIQVVLDFSISHGMIEENKNQYLIPYASENIGSETAGAERVRKHRVKNNKVLHCNNKETKCNTEIEIDTDSEKWQKINEMMQNKQFSKDKRNEKLENLSQANIHNQVIEIEI